MPGRSRVDRILQPLADSSLQIHLGRGLHTLGLIGWILEQTGCADVYVSTFSTSEAFLSGFNRLRQRGLINRASLLADFKASRKTLHLAKLMLSCFDSVALAQNHSKVIIIQNDIWRVSVVSSQNQTYGDRVECTVVSTDTEAAGYLLNAFKNIMEQSSHNINDLLGRIADRD